MKLLNIPLVTLFWLACLNTQALADSGSFEWLARTDALLPSFDDGERLYAPIWQIRQGKLQRVGGTQAAVEIQQLNAGLWTTVRTVAPQLVGSRVPNAVTSLDEGLAFGWHFDKTLKVSAWADDGKARDLFAIDARSIQDFFYNQGNGQLLGDEKFGFWVMNYSMGNAVFIEPKTWAIRAVPGLSPDKDLQARAPRFESATIGKDGTLWTLEREGMQLVRRNSLGKELVRVAGPFAKNTNLQTATQYGSGSLKPSHAGVIVLSGSRLEIASLDHNGRELWRKSLCPEGVTSSCAKASQLRGQLGAVQDAIGDEKGEVIASDSLRIFYFRGQDLANPVMAAGTQPLCKSVFGPGNVRPCVGDQHRAVPLAVNRWLVFALNPAVSPPFEMQLSAEPTPKVMFKALSGELMDQPLDVRQSVFELVYDLRAWPHYGNDSTGNQGLQARQFGIPTASAMVSRNTITSRILSPPGDAIRTPADAELDKLFDDPNQKTFPGARLGQHAVVIKDHRSRTTQLALYNAREKTLKQKVVIKGLPNISACSDFDTRDEYLFNDNQNKLYLLRGRSGQIYAIDEQLHARFVARPPEVVGSAVGPCGSSRSLGKVQSAIQMPSGDLLIATNTLLLLQNGGDFFTVEAPQFIQQIIPVDKQRVLVLARDGLAQVQLPQTFKTPSKVSVEKSGGSRTP